MEALEDLVLALQVGQVEDTVVMGELVAADLTLGMLRLRGIE